MPRQRIADGPMGNGWIEEVKTKRGTRFVAKWNNFVKDDAAPGGRRRVRGGSYEIGPKVHHGPKDSLKSRDTAMKYWLKICDAVMGRAPQLHPLQMAQKRFAGTRNRFTSPLVKRAGGIPRKECSITTRPNYSRCLGMCCLPA